MLCNNLVTAMNKKAVTINCYDCNYFGIFAYRFQKFLRKNYRYRVKFPKYNEYTIDLTMDGRKVKIISSRGQIKHCDVCIVQSWKHSATIISEVKQKLLKCKQHNPEAPIILVVDTRLSIDPCTYIKGR